MPCREPLTAQRHGALSFPPALAALAVPAFAFTDVKQVLGKRTAETAGLARLLEYVQRPAAEIFFVDLPGANRVHGRIDLVYDPWLYPVFESIGLAEPRSIWLEQALATGPVRVVATTSSRHRDRRTEPNASGARLSACPDALAPILSGPGKRRWTQ